MPRRLFLPFTILFILTFASTGAAAIENQGFIYGTVTTGNGKELTGFLRWDSEEAYWDDLFHSYRENITWLEDIDVELLKREREKAYFESHGLLDRLAYVLEGGSDPDFRRVFVCRFGDLTRIDIDEEEEITVTTNDGETHAIGGYSNDVSADIRVYEDGLDYEEIEWDDLASITFAQAPPEAVPYATRLFGQVRTTEGDFEGFLQWDKSENVSTDVLDGEDESGEDQELRMGDLARIERHSKEASKVTLGDGRTLILSGTNDVNHDNRGIMVEVAGLGKVTLPWKRFKDVTFHHDRGSGQARADFAPQRQLTGAVLTTDGTPLRGRLVLNFNEAWNWEIFNGTLSRMEYDLPLQRVLSIENRGDKGSRVTLVGGRILDLNDDQDTGKDHMGLLIYNTGAGEPDYVPWRLVKSVTLDQ